MKHFETQLPEGYTEVKRINAKKASFGIVMNLIALLVLAAVVTPAVISVKDRFRDDLTASLENASFFIIWLGFFVSLFAYIVLHELVHGIAYKLLTHRKLTFGISWSCAFCGVPDVYVYRRAALIALLSPFLVFSAILIPLTVCLSNALLKCCAAFLLGLHLGGCSGDLYDTFLFLFRYREPDVLVRDTGPEQVIYRKQ